MAQSISNLFKLLSRICVLGRVTLYSLSIAQCDGLSSHQLAGWIDLLGVRRTFSLSTSLNGMKFIVACMGECDEVQFGALKSGNFEKFQGKGRNF